MKFTHYDYKCTYYLPDSNYQTKTFTASNRAEINLGFEYHASSVSIYTDSKELEQFSLGVDFSPPGSLLENRCVDRLFLNFIIKGKGRLNSAPFSAGQFFYTLPLQKHIVETDPDDPFVSAWISISGTYAQHVVDELNEKSSASFMSLDNREDILKLTKTFLYEVNLGETSTDYLKSLINIYLSYVEPSVDDTQLNYHGMDKTTKLIIRSKRYVRKNLKHVTVADLAAAQHYNSKYFSRVFTEAMGMKPLEYITECRMEWAKNSLTHSNLSIPEIMEAIGYDHRNGFTTAFKKKYGCPPAEYRRRTKHTSS